MKLRTPNSTTFPVRLEILASERARRTHSYGPKTPTEVKTASEHRLRCGALVKTRRSESRRRRFSGQDRRIRCIADRVRPQERRWP